MRRKIRVLLLPAALLVVAVFWVIASASGLEQKASSFAGEQANFNVGQSRAACSMTYSSTTIASYFGGFTAGMQNVSYFDPAAFCTPPVYPFEITSFSFPLLDVDGSFVWPVTVDVVVYDAGVICDGPGGELCRFQVVADSATYAFPNVGTATFPVPCCVDGPFYIGLEYIDGQTGTTPSICYDDDNLGVDSCTHWFYYNGVWNEWSDIWNPPPPNDPMFWVDGETESVNCVPEECDWQPGDPYKMHYPQLPDEAGWDVMATEPVVLADDWMCSDTGWVKDIHFWGSWKNGIEGEILYFVLSIHEDIPAEQNPDGYSKPGATLWERDIAVFNATPIDPPTAEGWYDPSTGEYIIDDHQAYFQYNVCLDEPDWFWQEEGTIYWLNISAVVADPAQTSWGWKSTLDHWNDDAVWAYWGELNWIEIYEPEWEPFDPITNLFWIAMAPDGVFLDGGGTDFFGMGWYFYEMYDWWNIWFYDHPFDYGRFKEVHLEFDAFVLDPQYPASLELAINWSTDWWFENGFPGMPPLPGEPEDLAIGRLTVLLTEFPDGHYIIDTILPWYNPEWVSIDVRGYNFIIPEGMGIITHDCVQRQSLDLSFVITGEPPAADSGACCYPDPTGLGDWLCVYTTEDDCVNNYLGVYEGDGVQCEGMEACCLQDGQCVMADALCCVNELGGTPQGPGSSCTALEACCLPSGDCVMLDPLCCVDQGGTPLGPGSQCSVVQACCMPDGSCMTIDSLCCELMGGSPSPWGAPACLGDNNGNSIDDACEYPDTCTYYKAPYPDYAPAGMPDFDQKQDAWTGPTQQWSHCGPAALANCFWWFDSKFESNTTPPPAIIDNYPLVQSYSAAWDDHDPQNVMPLINALATCCNTNIIGPGTNFHAMVACANDWLTANGLVDSFTITPIPGMDPAIANIIIDEVGRSQDVILLLGFWEDMGGECKRVGGHYVTCAGMCEAELAICISDPYFDKNEGEPPAGSAHPSSVHNDAQFVSGPHGTIHHDKYYLGPVQFPCPLPFPVEVYGYPVGPADMVVFEWQNDGDFPSEGYTGGPVVTVIEYALIICPVECDIIIGDANGSDDIDIDDVVYLIAYIFSGGPPPTPYPTASGDANCSCSVDIDDVVYLIAYIFSGGPPPCSCLDWIATCGPLY